jgi:hypothetical protein
MEHENTDETRNPLVTDEGDDAMYAVDENGHNLDDYDWVPVLRKRRADGWSPQKQRRFIEALADTGSVADAARDISMSVMSCYRLRRSPGAESFAAAWDAAIREASKRLVDVAFERAINGTHEPIIDSNGNLRGARVRHNDRLLMFLLRAHAPATYARGPGHWNSSRTEMPRVLPVPAPVAEAISRLEPARPAAPETLMAPHALADALLTADILDGKLPHWRCDAEPPEPNEEPIMGEAFEEMLALAKQMGGAKREDDKNAPWHNL